ncbi:MAG: glycosyltransferase [Gammaproteobacteria bacterium]|nr:glycosyltransferase [Gammaproteobacteria bacterium]
MTRSRRKILFVAEAVTLAHVVRPLVMASSLNHDDYDVHIATASGFEFCYRNNDFPHWNINSISPERFMAALASGKPLYDFPTLKAYAEEELELFDKVNPDIVVGDFRLSLAVSAVTRKIPYVATVNAHWSPYSAFERFPVPDLPAVRLFGEKLVAAVFHRFQPVIFATHARPLNRLRKAYGLKPLGDLRCAYTWGDQTLYLDAPQLVPTRNLPPNHHYVGPAIWSPDTPLPEWWDNLESATPCVYVTLGSSGAIDLLPLVIEILGNMPVNVLLATAGRSKLLDVPGNVRCSDYLPGSDAAQRSALVVCNGGSATVYQALAKGVPVLGIASNMDQHLTMACVEQVGAGISVRSDAASPRLIEQKLQTLLADHRYLAAARQVQEWFEEYQLERRFPQFLDWFSGSDQH